MRHSEYSAVIIGSGAAGLYTALRLSRLINLPEGILLITKNSLQDSNSSHAQGGIVGVIRQNTGDDVDLHVKDTIKAGAGLTNENVTRYISDISDEVIKDLMDLGIKFDRTDSGNLNFTLEAAHSYKRILHVGGDATGKGIVDTLIEKVQSDSNITVMEHSIATELLINADKQCKGIILFNELTREHEIIYTAATIMATGGIGQLYKYTTNPECATGDGIDLAYNAGAIIQDLEFIQFHPTALAIPKSQDRFLISEAVRGEGAKLVDNNGKEFMVNYHDKKELAPRDIVTRAIFNEMNKKNTSNMFLNASLIETSKLLTRFPTISKHCKENGINIATTPIPVAPAAHYSMGGIKASIEGKTSIKGLYAIGEVASTGLHGANRLASNSLLECVVCAYELVDYLSFNNLMPPKKIDSQILNLINLYSKSTNGNSYDIKNLKSILKNIMWDKVGIIRNEKGLLEAKETILKMSKDFKRNRKCNNKEEYEYRNMLTTSLLIIDSALNRKESRGAHSRSDYKNMLGIGRHSNIDKYEKKGVVYVK